MRTVHIAPWLKSALHASSHPCMCTCVLRLGCFLFISPIFYFVPPFSFQPFLMFTSEFNERSRSNPLCDFRLGTVATSDHETPLTPYRSWCFSCVAGRGADDAHRKSGGYTGPPRVECDFMFLSSRAHLVNPGLTIFNMMDRESQSMA